MTGSKASVCNFIGKRRAIQRKMGLVGVPNSHGWTLTDKACSMQDILYGTYHFSFIKSSALYQISILGFKLMAYEKATPASNEFRFISKDFFGIASIRASLTADRGMGKYLFPASTPNRTIFMVRGEPFFMASWVASR